MLLVIALFYMAREYYGHLLGLSILKRPGDAVIGVGGIQRFAPAPGVD